MYVLVPFPSFEAELTAFLQTGTEDNLSPLATQLINHLESMQSNTAQVTDVGEALVRTRAAVDDACYRHLSLADYEQISGR
jgi:hypothetical protein